MRMPSQHKGHLYLLETDKGVLTKRPGTMWRMLTVHAHHEILFTSTFTPMQLSMQPNSKERTVAAYVNEWDAEVKTLLGALVEKYEASEGSKKASGKKKIGAKLENVQDHGSSKKTGENNGSVQDDESSGNKEPATAQYDGSSAENKKPTIAKVLETLPAGLKKDLDEYKWAKAEFKRFLEEYIDSEDDADDGMAFYVRMVEGWKNLKPSEVPNCAAIHYSHVDSFNGTLALAILNNRTRLYEVLSEVFLDFRVKRNCGTKKKLKGRVKIRVLGMPPAGSTCSFEEFLKSTNAELAEPHSLYDGTILNSATYIGRRASKGYVDDATDSHQRGKSWDGDISISDLGIKDGRFVILKPATVDASVSSISADFVQLATLIFKYYKTDKSDKAPAYFHAFQAEVLELESRFTDINSREFKVFQLYLSHHLAFKAPRVRAALFIEVWGDIQSLRPIGKNGRRAPFARLRTLWNDKEKEFSSKFTKGWFFDQVYAFENFANFVDKYEDCFEIQLLEHIRHLEAHLHDHTRNDKGEQLLDDVMLVDLMIEKTFYKSASALVYSMMMELNDSPFSSSWEHYKMFECGNDLQNIASVGGKGGKMHSGGIGSSTSESGETKNVVQNSASGSGEVKGSAKETDDVINQELGK